MAEERERLKDEMLGKVQTKMLFGSARSCATQTRRELRVGINRMLSSDQRFFCTCAHHFGADRFVGLKMLLVCA